MTAGQKTAIVLAAIGAAWWFLSGPTVARVPPAPTYGQAAAVTPLSDAEADFEPF